MEIAGNKNLFNNYTSVSTSNSDSSVQNQTNPFAVKSNSEVKQSSDVKSTSGVDAVGDVFVSSTSKTQQSSSPFAIKRQKADMWFFGTLNYIAPPKSASSKTIKTAMKNAIDPYSSELKKDLDSINSISGNSSTSEDDFEKQLEEVDKQLKVVAKEVNFKIDLLSDIDQATSQYVDNKGNLNPTVAALIQQPLSNVVNGKVDLTQAKSADDEKQVKEKFIKTLVDSLKTNIQALGGDPDKDDVTDEDYAAKSPGDTLNTESSSSATESKKTESNAANPLTGRAANIDQPEKIKILKTVLKSFKKEVNEN